MAPISFSFLTTALLLSASAVNGLAIHQPLDLTNGHYQPYTTTKGNREPHDIVIVTTDGHRQPLSYSSAQNSVQVCVTIGDNPDGTKHQICAENPDDLCYDSAWKVMPRPAKILPWCTSEETSTELKAKRLVVRQKAQGEKPGSGAQRGLVERGGKIPAPPVP